MLERVGWQVLPLHTGILSSQHDPFCRMPTSDRARDVLRLYLVCLYDFVVEVPEGLVYGLPFNSFPLLATLGYLIQLSRE